MKPWIVLGCILGVTACSMTPQQEGDASSAPSFRIIAINDFHGNISGEGLLWQGKPSGGVAWLAAHVARLREGVDDSVVVTAGDLIGASPLASGLFHDEPTVEAMNRLGLDLSAVGNHEFDEGREELLRMQRGGCHAGSGENTCRGADAGTPVPFEGAKFSWLAANVEDVQSGATLLPAQAIRELGGQKVGFIGMTLEGTPGVVAPSGVQGLRFLDEAETVNRLVPGLRAQGAEAIVVLIHEGGAQQGGINECEEISGDIATVVAGFDDAVDLVISGHTHEAYVCALPNAVGRRIPVTSAGSYGRVLSQIDVWLTPGGSDVADVRAVNHVAVQAAVSPDPGLATLVERYEALAQVAASRVVGSIAADIVRQPDASGASPLGALIADAQWASTRDKASGAADFSLVHPGGIRQDLRYAQDNGEGDGRVTFGESYAVQPFGNVLVTLALSGEEILALLEQQWGAEQAEPRILQVSSGVSYRHRFDPQGNFLAQRGKRLVCENSVRIHGKPLRKEAIYRVSASSFLTDGGDGFSVMTQGRKRVGGVPELEAMERYLASSPRPVAAPADRRIERVTQCD